jgi:hypothetical protein
MGVGSLEPAAPWTDIQDRLAQAERKCSVIYVYR